MNVQCATVHCILSIPPCVAFYPQGVGAHRCLLSLTASTLLLKARSRMCDPLDVLTTLRRRGVRWGWSPGDRSMGCGHAFDTAFHTGASLLCRCFATAKMALVDLQQFVLHSVPR